MPLPAAPKKRADLLPKSALTVLPRTIRSIQQEQAKTRSRSAKQGNSIRGDLPHAQPAHVDSASRVGSPGKEQRPQSMGQLIPWSAKESMSPLVPQEYVDPDAIAAPDVIPSSSPSRRSTPRKKAPHTAAATQKQKLFVLDTNVMLHDPMCLFNFAEHDIYLPLIVLEELDDKKKGLTDVARNARQISRTLDGLMTAHPSAIKDGLVLSATGHKHAKGRLVFQTEVLDTSMPLALPTGKADNQILSVVQALRARHTDRDVVLVSNDINMRVKAGALGLVAEDYTNDKTLDDADLLYSGRAALPQNFWSTHGQKIESWKHGNTTHYRVRGPVVRSMHINQFLSLDVPGEPAFIARVTEIQNDCAVISTIKDHGHPKHALLGVVAKNREQNFAMNLLMDRDVDFVTLVGTAGSGKTLMALAAGLQQIVEDHRYGEIIMTRATIPTGEDIGFLPGNEEEKMSPWMGALDDNLEFLSSIDRGAGEWGKAHQTELLKSKVKIKSMNFMRGRTFLNRYVIVDEAQNLTPKQMKTLVTRAGPGTKIVCLGNLAQIDTPYLTEGSSGLTYIVDRFKGWTHGGHITLARGERSRLAHHANEVL